jgi:hypothetical protein
VQENPQQALTLTPEQFAHQASIYVFDYPMIGVDDSGNTVEIPPWRPYGSNPDGSPKQMPGAQSILHMLQLTAASSLAAAFPTLAEVFKVTFPNTYPLLTPADYASIFAQVEPLRQAFLTRALNWARTQLLPTGAQVHDFMPILTLADADLVAAQARAEQGPIVPGKLGHIQVRGDGGKAPASPVATVAKGTAIAGGAGALAIAFVAAKNGISFAQAAKSVYVHGKSLVSRWEK